MVYFLIALVVKVSVFRIQGEKGGAVRDNWTFPAIYTSYLTALWACLFEFFYRHPQTNAVVSLLGYGLATGGILITRWSVMTLGRCWSIRIEIKQNHQVIAEGPYRLSRHPYYFGALAELIGLSLILHSFYALFYILVVHIPVMAARIRSEEGVLSESLETRYLDYKRTVSLLPAMGLSRLLSGQGGIRR